MEDDYLIARNILGLLQAAGATVMGPVGHVAQAVRFVRDRSAEFGSAVLDLDLHGQPS
ncbi:response regulator [Teichococcus vastitatis]|uniref:Response regulatory domain-containing protein n=1 Tax=Teichococcus vastitatis TaxID=2307076 RepID=A0ABS9W340_9PROT|nr:hypothetical protein [Pseudoroseomonas vastitatis]MCI0753711.1 hypothetical protein [Pseudoroseomonas vastitatis]